MPSLAEFVARLNSVVNRRCTCGYCGADQFDYEPPIPLASDEKGWSKLSCIHYPDCLWLRSRAYQLEILE
jgi:hypothetical protein